MTIWSSISTYTIACISRSAYRLTWSAMLTRLWCTACVNYVKCHLDDLAFSIYNAYNIVTNIIVIMILLRYARVADMMMLYPQALRSLGSALPQADPVDRRTCGGFYKSSLIYFNILCTKLSRFFCCSSYYKSIYVASLTFSSNMSLSSVVWI